MIICVDWGVVCVCCSPGDPLVTGLQILFESKGLSPKLLVPFLTLRFIHAKGTLDVFSFKNMMKSTALLRQMGCCTIIQNSGHVVYGDEYVGSLWSFGPSKQRVSLVVWTMCGHHGWLLSGYSQSGSHSLFCLKHSKQTSHQLCEFWVYLYLSVIVGWMLHLPKHTSHRLHHSGLLHNLARFGTVSLSMQMKASEWKCAWVWFL